SCDPDRRARTREGRAARSHHPGGRVARDRDGGEESVHAGSLDPHWRACGLDRRRNGARRRHRGGRTPRRATHGRRQDRHPRGDPQQAGIAHAGRVRAREAARRNGAQHPRANEAPRHGARLRARSSRALRWLGVPAPAERAADLNWRTDPRRRRRVRRAHVRPRLPGAADAAQDARLSERARGLTARSRGVRRAERRGAPPALAYVHHVHPQLSPGERRDDALAWCQGRGWTWRALLLAYLAYVSCRTLTDSEYWNIFAGITLVVHESGHVIFSPFGEMLEVAGGSIMQIATPLIAAALFLRQREYFGISVALAWLSMSFANLATYI